MKKFIIIIFLIFLLILTIMFSVYMNNYTKETLNICQIYAECEHIEIKYPSKNYSFCGISISEEDLKKECEVEE